MDIKKARKNDREIPDAYPGGDLSQGSAASDMNSAWYARAGSQSRGADVGFAAIRAESRENNLKFGTPDDDNLTNPADSNPSGDSTLKNPHNFSSNPGFMGTSTGSALMMAAPRPGVGLGSGLRGPDVRPTRVGGPTVGRSPISSKGNVSLPAPGDTDPRSEGSPQGRTSGFGG